VTEAACPFCGEQFANAFRASPKPQPPRGRLTRAAMFALGTGTLALAPACSSSSAPVVAEPAYGGPPQNEDGGGVGVDAAYGSPGIEFDGSVGALYGAFPIDAAGAGPGDATSDAPVAEPAYGGPPHDAEADHVSAIPLYGVAPH
jgi:hypothetical protein